MTARILIVDDSSANTRLLSATLGAEYYQVATASDGFDALAIAYIWQPDLVLLDVMMPDMDGYECCELLKADNLTCHIPVIMVTAAGEQEQRIYGLRSGADDFLIKPIDHDILIARIKGLSRIRRLIFDWHVQVERIRALGLGLDGFTKAVETEGKALLFMHRHRLLTTIEILREDRIVTVSSATDIEVLCLASFLDPDVYVVDLAAEQLDSLRIISVLRASNIACETPILVIAAASRKAQTLTALTLGATDCLQEPLNPVEVKLRIWNQIRRQIYRTWILANVGNVFELAIVDPLTGVYNRSLLRHHLHSTACKFKETALLMVDIDYFKDVNDTFGHPYGDYVLRQVADALKSNIRALDIVFRYGGEEFAVVMPNTGRHEARSVAEGLRLAVEHSQIVTVLSEPLYITISIGVASANAIRLSADTLIKAADAALYKAKRYGRNQVRVAEL